MGKKRAGIMTFHWATNYGAVLQAWALQNYMMSIGLDAELIDYVPKGLQASLFRCIRTKHPHEMRRRFDEYIKERNIEVFRKKYLRRSSVRYVDKAELLKAPPRYDYYISGSDQIWNPFFTMNGQRGITLSYFLDFAPMNAERIAFSSSFGLSHIPDEMRKAIQPELSKYRKISTRESAGVDILKSMAIDGVLTADPSLLLQADAYKSLLENEEQEDGSLFFYCLHGHRKDALRIVRNYADNESLKLIEDDNKGIEAWLNHILNAEFVITNSFHGVVFCLLFHTPFVAFEKKSEKRNMGGRITTLLKNVGINNRFCSLDELEERLKQLRGDQIDWKQVACNVEILRQQAQDYLNNAFKSVSAHSIEHVDIDQCTGCGLCQAVCPVSCIFMEEDERGFWYPKVNAEHCIQCGLCYRECIAENRPKVLAFDTTAYACYHTDGLVRQNSSSGGAFTAIAQSFLAQGGIVVGAAFTQPMEVEHICVDNEQGLAKLRGSKYMASRSWNAFPAIKRALQEGKKVLFSGTPCQVAAIKRYTNQHSDLFCIDVACHGVPSGAALKAHCTEIEKSTGRTVKSINFRDKITGWCSYSYSYMDENGHVIKRESINESAFGQAYVKNLTLRSSCMECPFACNQRQGDLTLCDHWRIVHLGLDKEDKGITAVLVNSEKGSHVLEAAAEQMVVEHIKPEEVYAGNPILCHPAGKNPSRNGFLGAIQQHGYKYATKKYCAPPSLMKKVVRKIKRLLK